MSFGSQIFLALHHKLFTQALYQTGTDLVFCSQLMSTNADLLADAAMGVANMTKLLPAAVRMSDTNIIEALCGNCSVQNLIPCFDGKKSFVM